VSWLWGDCLFCVLFFWGCCVGFVVWGWFFVGFVFVLVVFFVLGGGLCFVVLWGLCL